MAVSAVVRKREVKEWHRLDAEFWRPEYQDAYQVVSARDSVHTLGEIAGRMRKGIFYILANEYVEHGVPFLRVSNVKTILLDTNDLVCISEERNRQDKKTCFTRGDVVLSKTGDIGAAVIGLASCNISQDLIGLEVADKARHNPYYIATFLNTRYGQLQLRRWLEGQVQMHLGLADARKILVAFPSEEWQRVVEETVVAAESEANRSESLYRDAERVVLEALGWETLDLSQPKWWTAPLCRARGAQRLDADHFQPKYDKLIAHLEKTGKARPLGQIATYMKRGVQPRYVEGGEVLAINSRYVGRQLINSEQAERTDMAFWNDNPRARACKHDVIINSTGWGTIGRTNCVLHDEKTVVDNHVTIIRVKENACDPVYLAVYLNSRPGLMQTDKWLSGSSGQIELYPGDIARFVVHIPSEETQGRVADLVTQSYHARERAKTLLDEAKRKVGALIEGATGGQG